MFKGLKAGEGELTEEVTHLFFTDNTLVLCEADEGTLLNLRCVLRCFQALSSLKINLTKSELVRLGDGGTFMRLAKVLGCKVVKLHINYYMPLGAKYKDTRMWNSILVRFERRFAEWKRNL